MKHQTAGRPLKFKDETVQLNVRVPKKHFDQVKRAIYELLEKYRNL